MYCRVLPSEHRSDIRDWDIVPLRLQQKGVLVICPFAVRVSMRLSYRSY